LRNGIEIFIVKGGFKMRYGLFICVFFAVSLLLSGEMAWGEAKVQKFTVGSEEEATVWAIADSTGDRDMSVFVGADSDVLKKYAPPGSSPSGIMAFLVRTENETILIDAGLGEPSGARASQLLDGLSQIGVDPKDVTLILITHMHADHIGGLVRDGQKVFRPESFLRGSNMISGSAKNPLRFFPTARVALRWCATFWERTPAPMKHLSSTPLWLPESKHSTRADIHPAIRRFCWSAAGKSCFSGETSRTLRRSNFLVRTSTPATT
jgi:hypothetical protein